MRRAPAPLCRRSRRHARGHRSPERPPMDTAGRARRWRRLAAAIAATCLASATAGAQTPQRGTITGRVVEAASQQPIVAAQVAIAGTSLGTLTGADGRFTIRGVAPGTVSLRVLRVGYAEQTASVTVAAGQTATAD